MGKERENVRKCKAAKEEKEWKKKTKQKFQNKTDACTVRVHEYVYMHCFIAIVQFRYVLKLYYGYEINWNWNAIGTKKRIPSKMYALKKQIKCIA